MASITPVDLSPGENTGAGTPLRAGGALLNANDAAINDQLVAIQSALGIADLAVNMGVFTGNSVTDNATLKVVIQDLESLAEDLNTLDAAYAVNGTGSPLPGDAIETAIGKIHYILDSLGSALILAGTWDPATGAFPATANGGTVSGNATVAGYYFLVDGTGTVDGIDFLPGDRVICIAPGVPSTTTLAGSWHHSDSNISFDVIPGVRSDNDLGAVGSSNLAAHSDHKHSRDWAHSAVTADPSPAVHWTSYQASYVAAGAFSLPDAGTSVVGDQIRLVNVNGTELSVASVGAQTINGSTDDFITRSAGEVVTIEVTGAASYIASTGGDSLVYEAITADPAPASLSSKYHAVYPAAGVFTLPLRTNGTEGAIIELVNLNGMPITITPNPIDTIVNVNSDTFTSESVGQQLRIENTGAGWVVGPSTSSKLVTGAAELHARAGNQSGVSGYNFLTQIDRKGSGTITNNGAAGIVVSGGYFRWEMTAVQVSSGTIDMSPHADMGTATIKVDGTTFRPASDFGIVDARTTPKTIRYFRASSSGSGNIGAASMAVTQVETEQMRTFQTGALLADKAKPMFSDVWSGANNAGSANIVNKTGSYLFQANTSGVATASTGGASIGFLIRNETDNVNVATVTSQYSAIAGNVAHSPLMSAVVDLDPTKVYKVYAANYTNISAASIRACAYTATANTTTEVIRVDDAKVAALVHTRAGTGIETVAIPTGFATPIVTANSALGDVRISSITPTSFDVQVFDTAGVPQAGDVQVMILEATV